MLTKRSLLYKFSARAGTDLELKTKVCPSFFAQFFFFRQCGVGSAGFYLHSAPRLEQAREAWVANDVTCYLYFMEKRGQALFLQVCSHVLSYEHARGIVFNRAVSELWKATNCLNFAIIIDRKKSCFTNWFWCGIMTEQMEDIIQMAKIAPFE